MKKTLRVQVLSLRAIGIGYALAALGATPASRAADQYFAGDGSAFTASKWGPAGGPYTAAFTAGNTANFAVVNGFAGGAGGISVAGLYATENLTYTNPSGTLLTGGAVVPVTVASGKLLDLGTLAISAAAGVGFRKEGPGAFASAGGTYAGGFTLNAGTMILRGVNGMGGGAGNTLTLNAGAIGANANRALAGKYSGGITVGGDFQLGVSSNAVALASDTANLSFDNSVALGAATRTITIGANGTYILGGVISGSAGVGLTVSALAGASGKLALTNANTYPGPTTVRQGILTVIADGNLGTAPGGATPGHLTLEGGALQVSNSFALAANRGLALGPGTGAGSATVDVVGVSLDYGGIIADNGAGTGTLVKAGAGTLTLTGANTYKGGTVLVSNGTLRVGNNDALGTGRLTISGSNAVLSSDGGTPRTLTNVVTLATNCTLGSATDSGTLTLNGPISMGNGKRDLTVPSDVIMGGGVSNGASGGLQTKTGAGTLTYKGNWVELGRGTISLQDGSVVVDGARATNNAAIRIESKVAGGLARLTVTNGGELRISVASSHLRVGYDQNATATNSADIAATFSGASGGSKAYLGYGGGQAAKNILNLWPGGVLRVCAVVSEGAANNEFNFLGGTLAPAGSGSASAFMQGLTNAFVGDGGAVIDTEGISIGIAQSLLAGGAGGLTKKGAGALALTGTNTFTGATIVEAGKLSLLATGHGGGAITVSNDASLGVTLLGADTLRAASVVLGAGTEGWTTNEFALGAFGSLAVPALHATNLTVNGTNVVNLSGFGFSVGQYPLITYDSAVNLTDASFTNGTLPGGLAAYLTNNTANQSIDLVITALPNLLWRGQTDGLWDFETLNWTDATALAQAWFFNGANAIFDDGAQVTAVTVPSNVVPSVTIFNNTASNYTFTGAGSVGGGGALILNGGGTITMGLTGNTYAAGTLISNGVFVLGATNVIPDGPGKGNVRVNGTLDLAGMNDAVNGLSGRGVITNRGVLANTTNTLVVGSNNASGVFSGTIGDDVAKLAVTKVGLGTLTLSGTNTHSGPTTLSAGALLVGSDRALGAGPLTMFNGTTVASADAAPHALSNDVAVAGAAITLGDAVNTGPLTLGGVIDLGAATRTITVNSEAIWTGLSTNGSITKTGPATLWLQGVADWPGDRELTVEDGDLIVQGFVTNAGPMRPNCAVSGGVARMVVSNGAILAYSGDGNNLRAGYNGDVTATNILEIAGDLLYVGGSAGRLYLGRSCAFAQANLRSGGVLWARQVLPADAAPYGESEFNFDGGVLQAIAATNLFMQGLTNAYVRDGGAIFDTQGFDIGVNQQLLNGGAGGLEKRGAGRLTLASNHTYVGWTTLAGGTLALGTNGTIAASAGLDVKAGATADVAAVSGGFTLGASQTLKGNGTVVGSVTVSGALTPGASIGILSFVNDLTLGSSCVTTMEIAKAGATRSNDQAAVTGAVGFGGSLVVTRSGDTLAASDTFPLFTGGSFTGAFASLGLPTPPDDTAWDTNGLLTTGSLSLYAFTFSTQTLGAVKNTPATLPVFKLLEKATSPWTVGLVSVSTSSVMTGAVALAGTNIVYTPPTNYYGPDSFTCVLGDGHGTITATVDVTVTNADLSGGNMLPLALSGGSVQVRFAGIAGTAYTVQSATNLLSLPVNWRNLVTNTAPSNGVITYLDTSATNIYLQYYRTIVP